MTDNTREVELKSKFDATGVRTGVEQAKDAITDLGTTAQREGARAGAGLGKMGDGAEKAGQKIERETRSMISSIERATATFKAGERGSAAYFEELAKQRGVSGDALKPYIEQLRQAEIARKAATGGLKDMGVSAAQTTAALRQVPAQFTDIAVSLQAGQAPLTVLLQQGGQLKDMFGGVGNAARALGGYVLGLVNPLTVSAAAAGVLTLAYFQGAAEAENYTRALVNTGNAAGVTASQLADLARAQAGSVGTQGAAAAALAALTATAKVSAAVLPLASEAAVRMDRVGVAVDDTVKKFAELGKEPLKALVRLNETENFLTVSVYRRVKALVDQGKVVEAATVAQEEYARVSIERAQQVEGSLGSLQRGWTTVKDAAKLAWDAMMGIGRDDTAKQIESQIATLERRQAVLSKGNAAQKTSAVLLQEEIDLLKQQLDPLREVERLAGKSAQTKAEGARATKAAIDADEKAAEAAKKLAQVRDQEAAALERAMGLSGSYQKDLQQLIALREKGRLTEEAYVEAVKRLIAEQPAARAQIEAQTSAQKEAAKSLDVLLTAEQRRLDGLTKSAEQVAAQVLQLQEEEKAIALAAAANISLAEAIERVVIARLEEAQARATAEQDYGTAAALRAEIQQREKLAGLVGRKEARETAKRGAEDAAKEWKRGAEQIERTLTDALMRGFENGKSAAENFRDTVENMFKTKAVSLVVQAVVQPVAGVLSALLGGGAGGAGGYGSAVSAVAGGGQANGLMNLYSTGAGLYSAGSSLYTVGSQYLAGSMSGANAAGTLYANATGTGLDGLLASNGAYGTAAGGSSSSLATIGWIAAAVLGAMKASSDYSEGFNVSGAKDVTRSIFGSSFGPETARAGLLSSLGVSDRWASILSGSTALSKLFGRAAPVIQASGVDGSFSAGDFGGQAFADMFSKGGLFRSNKSWTEFQAIPQELSDVLDSGAKAALKEAQAYAEVLGLPADKLLTINSKARIQLGSDNEANQKAIVDAVAAYSTALAEGFKANVQPFVKAGESVADTITRLTGLQVFSNNLNVLGGVFSKLANSSVDAREQMIALVGGVDALSQQAMGFAQNYYNRDEIAGLKAADVQSALTKAGITTNVNSREDYRALVESLDPSSTKGREQLAVLLSLQGSFATVADYLTETGLTLGQAAGQAPASDTLSPLFAASTQQVQLTQQSVDIQYETRDATLQVVQAVQQLTALLASGQSVSAGRVPSYRTPEVGLA